MNIFLEGYSFSDLHKDCYGFRPSSSYMLGLTQEQARQEMDYMQEQICKQAAQERIDQRKALRDTFARMRAGAAEHGVNPFTYLRWMVQAEMIGDRDVTNSQDWDGVVGYEWGLTFQTSRRLFGIVNKTNH